MLVMTYCEAEEGSSDTCTWTPARFSHLSRADESDEYVFVDNDDHGQKGFIIER